MNTINSPLAAMRETPSDTSQLVSQALFGEEVEILATNDEWLCIKASDGYSGWTRKSSITTRSSPFQTDLKIYRLAAHLYLAPTVVQGPSLTLPFGSRLKLLASLDNRWLQVALPDDSVRYIQRGDISEYAPPRKPSDLPLFSLRFLNLPYTWGGRSSFGFDCSGFVQMLYREIGIQLPRDAKLQINDPQFTQVESPLPGDLLFFGESIEKITHVGLFFESGSFIHATTAENSPWIRISELSNPLWQRLFQQAKRLSTN